MGWGESVGHGGLLGGGGKAECVHRVGAFEKQ